MTNRKLIAGHSDWVRNPTTGKPAGRMVSEDVASVIPCRPDQVATLIACGLLRPLGRPVHNATRWFSICAVQAALADEAWLSEVTCVLCERDYKRNQAKSTRVGRRTGKGSDSHKFGSPVVEHPMPTVSFGS
jgi:hypothetical protein